MCVGWLVAGENDSLEIISTKDNDPVSQIFRPVIGIDMWEHAYYLQVVLPLLLCLQKDYTLYRRHSLLMHVSCHETV